MKLYRKAKFLVLVFAVCIAMSFMSPSTLAETKLGEGIVISMLTSAHAGDPFWTIVYKGAVDAGKLLGVDMRWFFGDDDSTRVADKMEEAIAAGVDGIGIHAGYPDIYRPVIQKARDAGIPVITFNVDDPGSARQAYIGQSLVRSGEVIAKELVERTGIGPGDHVVLARMVPAATYSVKRTEGITPVLDAVGATYETVDTTWEIPTFLKRMTSYLEGRPKPAAIICDGGQILAGVKLLMQQTGYKPGEIPVVGFDLNPGVVEGIREGYILATVDQQPYLQGFLTVLNLFLMAKYNFDAIDMDTGNYIVDKTNIDTIADLVEQGYR